jgi:hypothetical protein
MICCFFIPSKWECFYAGFEVLTAVIMNSPLYYLESPVFWDLTSCSPLTVDFRRTTRRHISEDRAVHLIFRIIGFSDFVYLLVHLILISEY